MTLFRDLNRRCAKLIGLKSFGVVCDFLFALGMKMIRNLSHGCGSLVSIMELVAMYLACGNVPCLYQFVAMYLAL